MIVWLWPVTLTMACAVVDPWLLLVLQMYVPLSLKSTDSSSNSLPLPTCSALSVADDNTAMSISTSLWHSYVTFSYLPLHHLTWNTCSATPILSHNGLWMPQLLIQIHKCSYVHKFNRPHWFTGTQLDSEVRSAPNFTLHTLRICVSGWLMISCK